MTRQNNKKESSNFISIAKQMENGLRRKVWKEKTLHIFVSWENGRKK